MIYEIKLKEKDLKESIKLADKFCQAENIEKERALKIRLVFEELITNMFRHAIKLGTTEVKVELKKSKNEEVLIIFTYDGDEFDPTNYRDKRINQSLEDGKEKGGLGLFLVMNFSKEFTYQRNNGVNKLSVKI